MELASADCEVLRLRCALSAMMLVLMVCGTNSSFARGGLQDWPGVDQQK
jgi:hypothetical protein